MGPLGPEELDVLERFNPTITCFEADRDLVREGERPTICMLLLEGMVCRWKMLKDGRRQIVSFHVQGDLIDFTSLLLGKIDHTITALNAVRTAAVPHAMLLEWAHRFPAMCLALWRDTLIDSSMYREWVVNVGRRSAYERIAHLLCEMVQRLHVVGLAPAYVCDLPITQSEFADATGLSTVHVNRTLQELRRNGLIELRGKTLRVLDWDGLQNAATFDSSYLYQLAAA